MSPETSPNPRPVVRGNGSSANVTAGCMPSAGCAARSYAALGGSWTSSSSPRDVEIGGDIDVDLDQPEQDDPYRRARVVADEQYGMK